MNTLICQYRILKINPPLFSYTQRDEINSDLQSTQCLQTDRHDTAVKPTVKDLLSDLLRTGQGLSTLLSTGLALNVFLLLTCRAQLSPLWWSGVGSHSSVAPGPASPTLIQQFLLAPPPRSLFPWCACPVGSCRTAAAALRSSKVGRHGAWDWGRHKRSV